MIKYSVLLIHSLPDKKIKSLGNKALINLGKLNLIDHQIQFIKKIFKNSEIIVVGGFEHRKLYKYLNKKYSNIKYIYHNINDYVNIGLSIKLGLKVSNGRNVVIINGSLFIDPKASSLIKKAKNHNYIISTKQTKSPIGCIKQNGSIENCFFDLPCSIYDFVIVNQTYVQDFKNCIYQTKDIDKFYMFEVINHCINNKMRFVTCEIDSRHIDIIDNNPIIQKITRKYKKYA